MSILLSAPSCRVRTFVPEDASSLARNGNNRPIWLNLRDRFPHPYTEKHAAWYIDFIQTKPGSPSFAIEVDGQAVGGVSLRPGEDGRIGISVYEGRGLAKVGFGYDRRTARRSGRAQLPSVR